MSQPPRKAKKAAPKRKPAKKRAAPRKAKSPPKKIIGKRTPLGRPSPYRKEYVEQARQLATFGATDIEIADFFGVSDRTIYRWADQHKDFCQALKLGRDEVDERVQRSLYHKATGYSFEAEKIFCDKGRVTRVKYREHVPPDTTACIFWLKNRRKAEWRDRQPEEQSSADSIVSLLQEIAEKRHAERLAQAAKTIEAVQIEKPEDK